MDGWNRKNDKMINRQTDRKTEQQKDKDNNRKDTKVRSVDKKDRRNE